MLPAFQSIPLSITQLSLGTVLTCGQSFRWHILSIENTKEYRLCLRDRVVCLRQTPTTLLYRAVFSTPQPTATEKSLKDAETLLWIRDYFQLDVDLAVLYDEWSQRDEVFASIQSKFPGIRILRQDPWENLVSFICSSNNNISRITRMVQNLCVHYSPSLLSFPGEEGSYHPFPPPSVLARPGVAANLRSLGFGYRADFVNRTAKLLLDSHGESVDNALEASERFLISLRDRSTNEARQELLKFIGVGRKVADCVLLMSLDKKEVIPVDTHIYQIALSCYGFKGPSGSNQKKTSINPKIYDAVNARLSSVWGDYAGWAHSVLFTADLSSFASGGAAPNTTGSLPFGSQNIPVTLSTMLPSKRRQDQTSADEVPLISGSLMASPSNMDDLSLTERIKKRRRGS